MTKHVNTEIRRGRRKKEATGAPQEGATGRLTHRLPGARGFTPAVLLPAAAAWTDASAVGLSRAPASIPRRPGRAARFTSASAASRDGSRTALRTARRGARSAWTRHATGLAGPSRCSYPDRWTPEPLFASAPSPDMPLELATQSVVKTSGPDPSSARREG